MVLRTQFVEKVFVFSETHVALSAVLGHLAELLLLPSAAQP